MNKKVIDNDRADVGRGAVVDPFVVFIYGALMPFVPYDFVSPFLPSIDAVLLQLLEIVLKLISIFFACWLGGRIFVALIYRVSAKWGKRLDVLLVAVILVGLWQVGVDSVNLYLNVVSGLSTLSIGDCFSLGSIASIVWLFWLATLGSSGIFAKKEIDEDDGPPTILASNCSAASPVHFQTLSAGNSNRAMTFPIAKSIVPSMEISPTNCPRVVRLISLDPTPGQNESAAMPGAHSSPKLNQRIETG